MLGMLHLVSDMDRSLGYRNGFHSPMYSSFCNFDSTRMNFYSAPRIDYQSPINNSASMVNYPFQQFSNPTHNLRSNYFAQPNPSCSIPPKPPPPDIYALPPSYPEYAYSIAQEAYQIHHNPSSEIYPKPSNPHNRPSISPELAYHNTPCYPYPLYNDVPSSQLGDHAMQSSFMAENTFPMRTRVTAESLVLKSEVQQLSDGKGRESDYQPLRNDIRTWKEDLQAALEKVEYNFSQCHSNSSSRYDYDTHPTYLHSMQVGDKVPKESDLENIYCASGDNVVYDNDCSPETENDNLCANFCNCELEEIHKDSAAEVFDIMLDSKYNNHVVNDHILDALTVKSIQQQYVDFNAELDALFDESIDVCYDDELFLGGEVVSGEDSASIGFRRVADISFFSLQHINNVYDDGNLVADREMLNEETSDFTCLQELEENQLYASGVFDELPTSVDMAHFIAVQEVCDELVDDRQILVDDDISSKSEIKIPNSSNSLEAPDESYVNLLNFEADEELHDGITLGSRNMEVLVISEEDTLEVQTITVAPNKVGDSGVLIFDPSGETCEVWWFMFEECTRDKCNIPEAVLVGSSSRNRATENSMQYPWDPGSEEATFEVKAHVDTRKVYANSVAIVHAAILSGVLNKMVHNLSVLDGSPRDILEVRWSFTIAIMSVMGLSANQQWDPGIPLWELECLQITSLSNYTCGLHF